MTLIKHNCDAEPLVARITNGHGHCISKPRRLCESIKTLERPALAEALARRQRQRRALHVIRELTRRDEGREITEIVFDRVHARRGHGPPPEISGSIQRDGGAMRHLTFKHFIGEEVQISLFIEVRPPPFFQLEPALYRR